MALFNKTDFIGIVPMSVNVPNDNVNLHCSDAQNLDTKPVMPIRVSDTSIDLIDDLIATESDHSTRPELWAFYDSYLLPYMVCLAHARFLLWQGNNITQFGVVVNQEDTSEPVTDKSRGELISSSEHKSNIYLARLWARLKDIEYTLDSIVYKKRDCGTKTRARTRTVAI